MNVNDLKNKKIHVIGITGSEGSAILSFLLKHQIDSITGHDFIEQKNLEKNFKLWHKGVSQIEKEKLWQKFQSSLQNITLNLEHDYLKDIEKADIIFVPQSWRLYLQNNKLKKLSTESSIPFYSLMRLYLEYSKAQVIGITGTVGKGSVSYILFQLLKQHPPTGGSVYFGGNETWMLQIADQLDLMTERDILILEISHRQLLDGIKKSPHIVVFTNLYPNHLDELSWHNYKNSKLSLLQLQGPQDISVLNYDNEELKNLAGFLKSKVLFYSEKSKEMNTKDIQKIYSHIMNTKSTHYHDNILAATTVAYELGSKIENIQESIIALATLPARSEYIGTVNNIKFYDDIKSTTPWSTLKAISILDRNIILISGGNTKGIEYDSFTRKIKEQIKFLIILKSELSNVIKSDLSPNQFMVVADLEEALNEAYNHASSGDSILVSPAAAFFYSKFIEGKKSLRKIITSLPPKETV